MILIFSAGLCKTGFFDIACAMVVGASCSDPLRFRFAVARDTIRPPLFRQTFFSNPDCLSAIVNKTLVKPWMLQRLLGGYALFWIIHKDLAQEIQKVLIEGCIGRYEVL
jgi:hypothetical protein